MLISVNVECWNAVAPGLSDVASWKAWFDSSSIEEDGANALNVKQIPPLLRRRFKLLGKVAAVSALNLMADDERLPAVFSSRHGDAGLTLSLLQAVGSGEPVSPTGFSLAVHNAVGGLLSIVRKDESPMTAIASSSGLVVNTLFEVVAQLDQYERVLCVIYDEPLPDFYKPYAISLPFPLAISFIATRNNVNSRINIKATQSVTSAGGRMDMLEFVRFLCGRDEVFLEANKQKWVLTMDSEDVE